MRGSTLLGGAMSALGVLGRIALALMMFNVVIDVSLRLIMGVSLGGTIEYVQYWWMVPLTVFGFVVAEHYRDHIDVPILTNLLDARVARFLVLFRTVLLVAFLGLITWFGWSTALNQMSVGEYGAAAGAPIWPVRFVIPLGAMFFLLAAVHNARRDMTSPSPEARDE